MPEEIKSIGFAPNLIPLILDGSKTLTYRLGNKYTCLNIGDKIDIRDSISGEIVATAEITEKSTVLFGNLPIKRKGHEEYSSKEIQRQRFKEYYGREIEDRELVLVFGFRIISRRK